MQATAAHLSQDWYWMLTLALLAHNRGVVRRDGEPGPRAGAVALFLYAASFSFAYVRLPAGVGALVLFAATQATMIGWGIYRGERPGGRETLGIGIALAGLVGLAAPGRTSPDAAGVALMLAAGISWGCYSLLGRNALDPVVSNARAFFGAAIPAILVVALPITPRLMTSRGVLLAVVSGSLASGVGYSLWYAALPHLSRPRAAAIQLTVPVLAAVSGIVLLGEAPTLRLAFAGVVILGGVALAVLGRGDATP
jgi:drug/metabolite transporter (DMT)-like permease